MLKAELQELFKEFQDYIKNENEYRASIASGYNEIPRLLEINFENFIEWIFND